MSSYIRVGDRPEDYDLKIVKGQLDKCRGGNEWLKRLLKSLGFAVYGGDIGVQRIAYYGGLKPCRCGRKPQVQEDIFNAGNWMVICPYCTMRTESNPKVMQAMKDWQADKLTEVSEMLAEPYGRDA